MYCILTLFALATLSCNVFSDDPPKQYWREWYLFRNFDGSTSSSLCPYLAKYAGLIPGTADSNQKILLNQSYVVRSMNLDGTENKCIIPDISNVTKLSHDRTKMLLIFDRSLYLANVDGSGQRLIPIEIEVNYTIFPTFSADDRFVYYAINTQTEDSSISKIIRYDIGTGSSEDIISRSAVRSTKIDWSVSYQDSIYYSYWEGNQKSLICRNMNSGEETEIYSGTVSNLVCSYPTNQLLFLNADTTELMSYHFDNHQIVCISQNNGSHLTISYLQDKIFTGNKIINLSTDEVTEWSGDKIFLDFSLDGTKILSHDRKAE
jgi:hypothetical protein